MFLSLGRMNWIFLPKSHLTLMSFCDFAIGFAQNDRVEGMLRKIKIHQTGLEQEKSESI